MVNNSSPAGPGPRRARAAGRTAAAATRGGVGPMAVAARDLHGLIGRVENDNLPTASRWSGARPGPASLAEPCLPARLPIVRPAELELEYETLLTRMEPESGILWAQMRHPERACFTPELMAD